MTLITFGYLTAAVAHLGLALTLLIARRTGWPMNYLLAASLLLCAWGVIMAVAVTRDITLGQLIAIDSLHAFAALLFLGQIIKRNDDSGWRRLFAWLPWLILPVAALVYWTSASEQSGSLQAAYYFIVAFSLGGLLAVEQIYRNAGLLKRRVVSLIAVALGVVFVFDLFTYSNAILLGALNEQAWAARGFVNALSVPLLLVALRRDPDWQSSLFISRHVVFYSASLVGVGLYLILVAFGGLLLQQFGGSFGAVLQVLFFVASLILLVLVLFSQQLRRRAKVFLATHFYANRYDYREEWLKLTRRLAQDSDRAPMPVLCLDALADIISSDGGVLWVPDPNDRDTYRVGASFGEFGQAHGLSAAHPLVMFMARTGWVVDGLEAERDPEHYGNAFVVPNEDVVTNDRIFVPLVLDRKLTGIAGLNRPAGMPAMNFEDHDLLRTVGQQLAIFLQRDRNRELLAEARQFEVFNRFTAFIMHDLKNLIAQQSLVVANAEKHKSNPEFVDDMVATIANSVSRMQKLLQQLQGDDRAGTQSTVDARDIAERAVKDAGGRLPKPRLAELERGLVSADAERLVAVLGHLIRNAQEACHRELGNVMVSVTNEGETVMVAITDDGEGMTAEFIRERLFKPFESTKGASGMGIGVYQARDYVQSLGGMLRVTSEPGSGTRIEVRLPRATQQ